MKTRIKKISKALLFGILGILLLLVLLILSLRIPSVQNFVKDRLIVYLEDKIQTKVQLDRVYVGFPNRILLEKFYLQGQQVDTLLYVESLNVALDIPQLINSKADITSVDLKGVRTNVVRSENGDFNFQYIIDAFATQDEEESESKPFIISLDKLRFRDIDVSFVDKQAKNDVRVYFNELDVRVKEFDLEKNKYALDKILLDGLKLNFKQDLLSEIADNVQQKVDSLSNQKPMQLDLGKIKLTNINVNYLDENSKTYAKIDLGEFYTKFNKLDLPNMQFVLDEISLKKSTIDAQLSLATTDETTTVKIEEKSDLPKLGIQLNKLLFDDVKLSYHNNAQPKAKEGVDFNHLDFTRLNVLLENFEMKDNAFSGEVKKGEIVEKSGLNIERFETDFYYGQKQAYLKNLYLQTPQTLLKEEVILTYESVDQLTNQLDKVAIQLNLNNNKIGFKDLLLLAPDLKNTSPFSTYKNEILAFDAKISGKIEDLFLQKIIVKGFDGTYVDIKGRIKNATNPDKLWYDIKAKRIATTAKAIKKLAPPNTIPTNIQLPNSFTLSGVAKGTTKQVDSQLKLLTSYGNADIKANVDMRKPNSEKYDIVANFKKLYAGKFIQNSDIGAIDGIVTINGVGFAPNTAKAIIDAKIHSATYQNYTYRTIDIKGNLANSQLNANIASKDENAQLKLLVSTSISDKPTLKVTGNLTKIDLHKLGFYSTPMQFAGIVDVGFQNIDPDALNGYVYLEEFEVSDERSVFPVSDIRLEAQSDENHNKITLTSQLLDAEIQGKFKLTQIADALMQTVNEYYSLPIQMNKKKIDPHQYFTFEAQVKNNPLIRRFLPDLTYFENLTAEGSFEADSKKIELEAHIPQLVYADNNIQKVDFFIHNREEALFYDLALEELKMEQFALSKITLNGKVAENIIDYELASKDYDGNQQYLIAGNAENLANAIKISLLPDKLMLNYLDWEVSPENELLIAKEGIYANQFLLSNKDSKIQLQTDESTPSKPLNISIRNFKIEDITEMIKKDTLLAKGVIDGDIRVENLTKEMAFTSDVTISDLHVFGNQIGKITAKVDNNTSEQYNVFVQLSENANDVLVTGKYKTTDSNFDFDVDIKNLQMKTIESFSFGKLQNTKGFFSGHLVVSGTADKPSILGRIDANNIAFSVKEYGVNLTNINDGVAFTHSGLEFNRFRLYDTAGNDMVVNGVINTKDYQKFDFGLNISGHNFKVVNTEKEASNMVYGTLALDANINIKGNLDLPKVDGTLRITDQTDFTFVMPQTSPAVQERDGIVEFIHPNQQLEIEESEEEKQVQIKGLDANINISLDPKAQMSIIIDQANGDFVKLKGDAELSAGVDPSGKTTLVGRFEVKEGAYEMSFNLIKRKFDIKNGSSITWTGEPTKADVDITAVYVANAAPLDLIENQLAGKSTSEINLYKQRMPFNTLLKMKGELMKPEISFDIEIDEENPSVSSQVMTDVKSKLEQLRTEEAEMNKQVFALLLLNRFVGENPFASSTGVSAETMARQSVSKLLSQQLNNLASDLISGVEIDFDLESTENYSTGDKKMRTDLNVGVSKTLFNDRLKVSIGSNFGLEGEERPNEQMTNIAGDIRLDYTLSKNGRYRLRAYRKNEYQVALQGQIVETGVGFIITIDYDKFREIIGKQRRKTIRLTDDNQIIQHDIK